MTQDPLHTYTWNAENRPATIDSTGLTYDALNRMVESSSPSAELVYGPDGTWQGNFVGQLARRVFYKLPAGARAAYDEANGGLYYYDHPDWLRSIRLSSTPTRGIFADSAYAPDGEQYAQTGSLGGFFAGLQADFEVGEFEAPARQYSVQGRWASPDPAGLAAVDPTNPQTWNRYAYVANNPLSFVDPTGLQLRGPAGTLGNISDPSAFSPNGIVPVYGSFENGDAWGQIGWIIFGGWVSGGPPSNSGGGLCYYFLQDPCGNSGPAINGKSPCVSTSSLNWLQKAQLTAAQFYSALTGLTFGFGAGLDAGAGIGPKSTSWNFGVGGSASTLIVVDASGNSGFLNSASGGFSAVKMSSAGSWWGAGAAAGPSFLISPNPISTIAGPSGSFSAGGGEVLGGGFSITTSGAVTVTVGVGAGAEAGISPQFGTSQFIPFCHN